MLLTYIATEEMQLYKVLLVLHILSLAFPSGHCCCGRVCKAAFVVVGGSAFYEYFKDQIKDFWFNTLVESIKMVWQILTGPREGNFPPVKLLRDPPQHKCITRLEELTQLKELLHSFYSSTDNKAVYAVYLVGPPGSGKSELARQYGNHVYERGEVSTVITLSTESEGQFRDDLIKAVRKLKAALGNDTKRKDYDGEKMGNLVDELQTLLERRPGWLLIVDNIRDHEVTQKSFYKKLPNPGTTNWGKGQMILTTQVSLPCGGEYVKPMETNRGMTPKDAKRFLCEQVLRGEGDCPDRDAERIVNELWRLPLAILAAGTSIRDEREWKESFTLADYLVQLDNISEAMNSSSSETDYPHSMWSALFLAVRSSVEGHSNAEIFKDFCALVGFIDQEEISLDLVESYLRMKGHTNKSIRKSKLKEFPLVEYLKKRKVFRVHQVTRNAFQAELIERSARHSARGDLLLQNIQNISHFFFTRYDEEEVGLWEALSYFHFVLFHHIYSFNDIISPDENVKVAASLVFRLVETRLIFRSPLFSCSNLKHFVVRLFSAPENTGNTSYLRFTGCRLVHNCFQFQQDNQTDLSDEYAVKGVEIIRELVPESPELHTMNFFEEKRYSFIQSIQSVEPTDKEDSDRMYLSFFRVATVLYRWDLDSVFFLGTMFLEKEMLNGARVWLEAILRLCQSGVTEDKLSQCLKLPVELGITYLKLKQYNAAEDILLQATENDRLWTLIDYEDYEKYEIGCMLAEVQIRLHKYSEALFSLEEELDEYGILVHGNWTLCEKDDGGNHRIRVATEVLEIYHSLYIIVPESLQEAMRRVERKLMQLLTEILSCEYVNDEKAARRGRPLSVYGISDKLFRRLHHIIKKQISDNHTRNLTELTIGVAEIILKRLFNPSSLVDELRVTLAFFKCVEHAQPDRPFTLILTIAFGTVLFLVFLLVITSIFS